MDLEIFPFELNRDKLNAMPEQERTLLFLLGHASNEISVLQKLLIATALNRPQPQFVDNVEAAQGMIVLRILIGKLHEAGRLLHTRFLARRDVALKYVPALDARGAEALTFLKKHFAKSPLSRLRNDGKSRYSLAGSSC